jgi:GrpB-like predicted nucleotidyltransferase (UPF0157 family)
VHVTEPVVIVDYDPAWPSMFASLGERIRAKLGSVAIRIDHIGSTAVPGLAAKPIIDVQVSVERLEPDDEFRTPLQAVGFIHRVGGVERTKRYFREPPGGRRTHIHVRRAGSFSEQFALLFRDYLRSDGSAAHEYEAVKRELAERLRDDRHAYVDAKTRMVWELMRRADEWAGRVGWAPWPSDA